MDVEKRFLPQTAARACVERRADGSGVRITGYGAVFYKAGDKTTEFELADGIVERIMPGAFDRALREASDVRSLFNHDTNFVLGRTEAGTLRLSKDATGLRYEIDAPDTGVIEDLVLSPIRRGDVSGSSFMFVANSVRWRDEGPLAVRELHDVDLFEVGPVTFPAYRGTTADVNAAGRRRTNGKPARRPGRQRSDRNCPAHGRIADHIDRLAERITKLGQKREAARMARRRRGIALRAQYVRQMERDQGPRPRPPSRHALRKRLKYVDLMERS